MTNEYIPFTAGRSGTFIIHCRRPIARVGVLVSSLILVIGSASSRAQQLAVISRAEDALVYIDLETNEEVRRIGLGRMCHELAVDPIRQRAYTGSYRGNTVHAIDLKTHTSRKFDLGNFRRIHGVTLSAERDVLFVTSEDSSAVLEIDPETGAVLRVWPAPGLQAHMVAVTPDGTKFYVGSEKPGLVMVMDRRTGETKTLNTGTFTVDVEISPDSTEVWVAVRDEGRIVIIDVDTDEIVATVDPGGNSPAKIQFHPDGNELWVSHHLGTTVTVLDRKSRTVIGTVEVGERPLGLVFNDDGSRVYVSRTRANEIVEIDAATRKVTRRIPAPANPDAMIWFSENMAVPSDHQK